MANIRDIAKLTGYSITTISRVINHHPYVDEEKRQKVLQVMEDLNYIPNRTAQNLSSGKTRNLGVILPFVDHPFYDEMLNGILTTAFQHNYKVTLLPTNYDPTQEEIYLQEFAAKAFDGLIVTTRANDFAVFKSYLQHGPIIFCEEVPDDSVPYVTFNRSASLDESLHYLKKQGCQRLGLVLGRSKRISENSKLTLKNSRAIFPDFEEKNIFWDCIHGEDGIQAAAFFQAQQVDGIISNGDEVAAEILRHWTSPKKPLIVGREKLLISEVMGFPSVNHHLFTCGKIAVELFIEKRIEQIVIPYDFIIR